MSKFPTEQIRALKLSYEICYKVIGLKKYVDENVAIQTLEAIGYTVRLDEA